MTSARPTATRVAVYHTNSHITLESRPVRDPEPGEIVMRVHASGICGSDLMEWYRVPRAPTVLGHEVAGSIVALGDEIDALEVGDRIVATHHVPCLVCRYCLTGRETMCDMLRATNFDPGGFSEYIRLPAANVVRGTLAIPAHVSDDAASFTEPLGCVLRGQRKLGLAPGQTVLVMGAGISGCLHVLAARALGAATVIATDIDPARRARAEQLGADVVLDAKDPVPEMVRDHLGRGVDRVVLCTSARSAITQALGAVDRGGAVLFFAPLPPGEEYPMPFSGLPWRDDLTLTSSYGAGPGDMVLALDLIASRLHMLDELVTHRIPLDEIQHGFELMQRGGASLKIVVDPRLPS